MDGYPDGTFKPDQPVTRQEFAAMLANYAVGAYEAGSEADPSEFVDASSADDWAKESIEWAVHADILHGKISADLGTDRFSIKAHERSAQELEFRENVCCLRAFCESRSVRYVPAPREGKDA